MGRSVVVSLFISIFILALAWIPASKALRFSPRSSPQTLGIARSYKLMAAGDPGAPQIDERTKGKIDALVKEHKVLLFMKGNKLYPQWYVIL